MPKPGRSRSQNTASRCSTDNASTVRLVITRSWRLGMAFESVRSKGDDDEEDDGNSTLCQAAPAFAIKRGEDPIPPPPEPEPAMAVLAERYMRDYVPSHCRASSAEVYRRALDNHILPALGEMRVGAVGREQVMELHYAMRGAPHAANAVLKIVAKILSRPNPCRAVRKYRTHPRERFLTGEEYRRLGRAIDELGRRGRCRGMRRRRSGC